MFIFFKNKKNIHTRHSYDIHSNIRSPHSFVFIFEGKVISFFLTHIAFKITIVNKIFYKKDTISLREYNRIWKRKLYLQAGRLKAQADVQVQASVFRELALELTLAAMAPYAATKPVVAQAPATLVMEMISPTAGVARPRTR
jgi:hypothetical protein